ncbi:MAG: glycosyltransferase, partial [Promethearchaeota archaeon]
MPPTKGVSDYVVAYLSNAPTDLQFYCYPIAQLAPDALYPGGGALTNEDSGVRLPSNVRVVNELSYYGLSGWVRSGLASNVDVFHIHWWTPFLLVPYLLLMSILQARGVKTVLTLHNVTAHENKILHDLGTRLLLTMTDHIIVHTKSGKGRLVNSFGVNPAKISVLAHGLLKPREMAMREKGAEARERLGLPQDKVILLFFGNIRPYKGLDILLEAMKTIQSVE